MVLTTSLAHRLSSLPEAATFVGLVSSIDPIHIQNVVNILVRISSFAKCGAFIAPSLIFNAFLATFPRIYKHIMRQNDCSHWDPILYLHFTTREARTQSFNKMCHSPVNILLKPSAKPVSSILVGNFNISVFITGKNPQ